MPSNNFESAAHYSIKIAGQAIPSEMFNDIIEVIIESNLYLPDLLTIQLHDDLLQWVDSGTLAIGTEIEVTVNGTPVFKGEITALEPEFQQSARVYLLIRAYDQSHRLHRGKKIRSFTNQTDSGIVKKIATEAGLQAQVDNTTVTHEYVFQNNQTNMEFLLWRAARLGYQVYVDNKTLYFKKGDSTTGAGPTLEWGVGLREFRPSISAVHQSDEVVVRGWDCQTKKAVTATVKANGHKYQGGITESGGQLAKSAFAGSAQELIVSEPLQDQQEAKTLADALSSQINGEFLHAEGTCIGNPRIKAGKTITIKGVGRRFSGSYLVTAATHILQEGVYTTSFVLGGKEAHSINNLLETRNGGRAGRATVDGVVPGLVTNLNDPDDLGRVKVAFPWMGDGIESTWARVAPPFAGQGKKGMYYLPDVQDEVLVAFEHGDVSRPYIIGALWNRKDRPPKGNKQVVQRGKVKEFILQSRSGHLVSLDDTSGAEKITIRDKTQKNEVIIDSKKNSLSINVADGISIQAKGKISLASTANDIDINCNNLSIKTKQNCSIQATQNLTMKATAKMDLQATQRAMLTGIAGLEVKNAAASIKLNGPSVNVNNGALEVI